jgi:hypothetical protein
MIASLSAKYEYEVDGQHTHAAHRPGRRNPEQVHKDSIATGLRSFRLLLTVLTVF